jgi:hypothetical protein
MLSHCENVRTSKFWQKSKEKEQIFFQKFDLGQKKIQYYFMLVYL